MNDPENTELEKTEQELYSRNAPQAEEFHDLEHGKNLAVEKAWHTERPAVRHSFIGHAAHEAGNFAKIFFFFSIGALLIAGGIAAYMLFGSDSGFSNEKINVRILGAGFSDGGAALPISIEITNKNGASLHDARVVVAYEKESSGGASDFIELPATDVGIITSGETKTINQTITLFGGQNATKHIRATLQYHIANSNAVLSKETLFPVIINRAPIILSVDGPSASTPNQPITFTVTATSNAEAPLENVLLQVEHPGSFVFDNATPAATYGKNVWALGTMRKGAEARISFSGKLRSFAGEAPTFRFIVGTESSADKTKIGLVYNSFEQPVALSSSFLAVSASINDSTNDTVSLPAGTNARVSLTYANTTNARVSDAEIVVHLSGNAFDPGGVSVQNGFFNSGSGAVIFDKNTVGGLAVIEPGGTGTVSFSLAPLEPWSGASLVQNPVINFSVDVSGKRSGFGESTRVASVEQKKVQFATRLQIASETLYTGGPFANSGPVPPRAEQQTTYTILWSIKNTSGIASGVTVQATLPAYVQWMNAVYPVGSPITYDSTSRTIVWRAGTVDPGAGLFGQDKTVAFQVGMVPSKSQINTSPPLVLNVRATGTDAATTLPLSSTRGDITTMLSDGSDNGMVQ